MKKISLIALFIFWAVVTALLTAAFIAGNDKNCLSGSQQTVQQNNLNLAPGQSIVLSLTEIAKHNRQNDCWLIINNKVYDVTAELSSHPGGIDAMLPYCGQDGTAAFQTKDLNPGRNHSGNASSLLQNYLLGNLNQRLLVSNFSRFSRMLIIMRPKRPGS